MNDRISGDNHAIVRAGMCTALVVVLSLLGFYMPLLSTVVFLLIPLPIAYLGMKEGVKWSIVVTTGVLVLDSTFFGVVSAAFVCAIFGLLGVTMGICYRFKVSAAKTLIAGAVVVLLALVAEGIATSIDLARKIKEKRSDAVFIFIMPPSMEILKSRLVLRKTETKEQIVEDVEKLSR